MAVEDSGIGDPYWYEWTVGQVRIVEMLNPESHIKSVTLQKSGRKGLDDVIVRYDDGRPDEYIQVKHTRADATLTFGDLTTQDKDGESLLSYLAKSWQAITSGGQQARAVLYTNRQAGSRPYGTRPALSEFWPAIQTQLSSAVSLAGLQIPSELGEAWKQWSGQLATLPSERERLAFLKSLDVQTGAPDLESLHENVVINLARRFGIQRTQAVPLASALDSALRRWATSYRTKDEITLEDVFEALTLPGREQIGDHELPPPAPFFLSRSDFLQALASTLAARQTPVVFLSGPPGCGKTGLISALSNRHDPVVTARFHAYKPITPTTSELPTDAGRTTSARALWSDLLTQLRDWFRKTSKLARYSVPIRNDFLNVEQMRAHVLTLADAWALETGQHTVIAIDGIDHAARSEQPGTWNLLDSLPAPEQVPAHVVFLVAGQLAAANPKYPLWLRTQHPLVTVCEVPGISDGDIAQALDAQKTAIPSEEHPAVVRVIATFARGNTLSAMFAVWECSDCSNVAELEARLKERKLSQGLSDYYDSIWGAAVAQVEGVAPLTARYVAAAISLTAVPLTGAMLASLFEDILRSALLWNEVLARLRPLLVESADGFRLHHNDVRVHLMKLLGQDPTILSNVAYRLAQYYMSRPELRQQKHGEGLNLLRRARRPREIAELVTPGWILEGWVLRRTMQELVEDTQAGARAALEVKDWDLLHQTCCAGLTLSQLRRSDASLEARPRENRDRMMPPVLPTEGRVLPESQWTPQLVRDVIQDAETLVSGGAVARASDLLKRWFRDSPPGEIAQHLGRSEAQPGRRQLDDDGRRALERWGAVSQHTGLTWRPIRDEKDVRWWPAADAAFLHGRIDEALRQRGPAALKKALRCRCVFDPRHIASAIETLFLEARFPELVVLLEHLPSSVAGPLLLKARVASVVLRRRRLAAKFSAADERPFALINLDDYQERLASHADACALIAMGNVAREPASIRDDALESLYRNYEDKRERPLAALVLYASATVARLFGILSRRGAEAATAFAAPQQLAKLLEDLLAGLREPIKVPLGYHDTVAVILFGVLRISRGLGAEHDRAVIEYLKRFTTEFPVSRFVEIVADGLRSRGEIQALNAWVKNVIGVDGVAWRSAGSERLEIARRFESVAQGLDTEPEAHAAVERCHWGSIAYADRKEYSLEAPLAWFNRLASKDPSRWRHEGLELLAIAHEAGRVGDNRTEHRVRDAVMTAAIQSGPQAVSALINASSSRGSIAWLPQPGASLAGGYAASVEKLTYAADDLLTVWALTLGTHAWEDDEDAGSLHDISRALGEAAERIGRGDLKSVMRDIGPAESHGTRAKKSEESVPENPILLATIEDAEDLFSRQAEPRVTLLAPLSRQIRASPPSSERDTQVERLLRLVSRRDRRYSWSYDGAGRVLRNLVPLLSEDIRWSLAESSILETEGEQADVWLAHMEDIDELCLERAAVLSDGFLERGANRLLQMHEFWITGGGHLPEMAKPILVPPSDSAASLTWLELSLDLLVPLLRLNGTLDVSCCLRGLFALVENVPSAGSFLVARVGTLPTRDQELVLLVLERLASSAPAQFAALIPWVGEKLGSPELKIGLQAWVALCAYSRRTGEPMSDRPSPREPGEGASTRTILVRPNRPGLLQYQATNAGRFRFPQPFEFVRSLFRRVCAMTNEELSELEADFVASLPNEFEEKPAKRSATRYFDVEIRESEIVSSAFRFLDQRYSEGAWEGVSTGHLAQAILPGDDPWVLLRTPSPAGDVSHWPVDRELEQVLNSQGQDAVTELFRKQTSLGLSPGETVLGAVLTSYTDSLDFEYVFGYEVVEGATRLASPAMPRTFARSFAFYDPNRWEPGSERRWLTLRAGGLLRFPDGLFALVPPVAWQTSLGWQPLPDDPRRWHTRGGAILRYEYLNGQLRHPGGKPISRQPLLQRWVCDSVVLDEIRASAGAGLVSRQDLEILASTYE